MTLIYLHNGMDAEFVPVVMIGGPLDGQRVMLLKVNGKCPWRYASYPDGQNAAIYYPVGDRRERPLFRYHGTVPVADLRELDRLDGPTTLTENVMIERAIGGRTTGSHFMRTRRPHDDLVVRWRPEVRTVPPLPLHGAYRASDGKSVVILYRWFGSYDVLGRVVSDTEVCLDADEQDALPLEAWETFMSLPEGTTFSLNGRAWTKLAVTEIKGLVDGREYVLASNRR